MFQFDIAFFFFTEISSEILLHKTIQKIFAIIPTVLKVLKYIDMAVGGVTDPPKIFL